MQLTRKREHKCAVVKGNGEVCGKMCRNFVELLEHWRTRHPADYDKAAKLAGKMNLAKKI